MTTTPKSTDRVTNVYLCLCKTLFKNAANVERLSQLQADKEKSPAAPGDTITSLPISIPLSTVHPSKLPVSIPLASVVLPNRAERLVRIYVGGSDDTQSCGCSLPTFQH